MKKLTKFLISTPLVATIAFCLATGTINSANAADPSMNSGGPLPQNQELHIGTLYDIKGLVIEKGLVFPITGYDTGGNWDYRRVLEHYIGRLQERLNMGDPKFEKQEALNKSDPVRAEGTKKQATTVFQYFLGDIHIHSGALILSSIYDGNNNVIDLGGMFGSAPRKLIFHVGGEVVPSDRIVEWITGSVMDGYTQIMTRMQDFVGDSGPGVEPGVEPGDEPDVEPYNAAHISLTGNPSTQVQTVYGSALGQDSIDRLPMSIIGGLVGDVLKVHFLTQGGFPYIDPLIKIRVGTNEMPLKRILEFSLMNSGPHHPAFFGPQSPIKIVGDDSVFKLKKDDILITGLDNILRNIYYMGRANRERAAVGVLDVLRSKKVLSFLFRPGGLLSQPTYITNTRHRPETLKCRLLPLSSISINGNVNFQPDLRYINGVSNVVSRFWRTYGNLLNMSNLSGGGLNLGGFNFNNLDRRTLISELVTGIASSLINKSIVMYVGVPPKMNSLYFGIGGMGRVPMLREFLSIVNTPRIPTHVTLPNPGFLPSMKILACNGTLNLCGGKYIVHYPIKANGDPMAGAQVKTEEDSKLIMAKDVMFNEMMGSYMMLMRLMHESR